MRKLNAAAILIGLALMERLKFDLGANVELVTLSALVAAVYLGMPWAWVVPLTSLAISDYFLGNTAIFLFTWSAYILIGCGALVIRCCYSHNESKQHGLHAGVRLVKPWSVRLGIERLLKLSVFAGTYSVGAVIFFYLWTNFGVWLISGMYPQTLGGLMKSYYMGLPFLKWHLVSNLVVVPIGFVVIELGVNLFKHWGLAWTGLSQLFREAKQLRRD